MTASKEGAGGGAHVLIPAEQYAELLRIKEQAQARAADDFSRVSVTGQLRELEARLEVTLEGRLDGSRGGVLALGLGETLLVGAPSVERLDPAAGNARQKLEHWRKDYNEQRPHSALGGLPPMEHLRRIMEITNGSANREKL